MKCLYCNKRVIVFRFLTGGEVFCSEEHRELYRKGQADSAIERILKMDVAPKKPLRPVAAEVPPPAPAVEALPEELPEEPGFRLPVLAAQAPADPAASIGLIAAVLEPPSARLTELTLVAGLTSDYSAPPFWFVEPETAITQAAAAAELNLQPTVRPGWPGTEWVGAAPVWRGTATASGYGWRATDDVAFVSAASSLVPQPTRTLMRPELESGSWSGALRSAGVRPVWLSQGQADASTLGLETAETREPGVVYPKPEAAPFVTRWHAQAAQASDWRKPQAGPERWLALDCLALDATSLEGVEERLRFPLASGDRDARPTAPPAQPLLADLAKPVYAEVAEAALARPTVLDHLEFRYVPQAPRAQWDIEPVRPLNPIRGVAVEPAVDLALWTSWPDLALPQLGVKATANRPFSLVRAGLPWAYSVATVAARLVETPERCLIPQMTPPVAERRPASPPAILRFGSPVPLAGRNWPTAVPTVREPELQQPAVPAARATALFRSEVRAAGMTAAAPVGTNVAAPQPIEPKPAWGWPASSEAPEAELRGTPIWSAFPRHTPQAVPAAWNQELSAPQATRQPDLPDERTLSPEAVAVRRWELAALPDPASTPVAPALALQEVEVTVHVMDSSSQAALSLRSNRPLESTIAWQGLPLGAGSTRREIPRLSIQEMPTLVAVTLPDAVAQPSRGPWTPLALSPAAFGRELPPAPQLAAPGETLQRPSPQPLAGCQFAASGTGWPGWRAAELAPEAAKPAAKRRPLPASRPKMNLPRPVAPQQAMLLPEVAGAVVAGAVVAGAVVAGAVVAGAVLRQDESVQVESPADPVNA